MKKYLISLVLICMAISVKAQFLSEDKVYLYLSTNETLSNENASITKIIFQKNKLIERYERVKSVKSNISRNRNYLQDIELNIKNGSYSGSSGPRVYNSELSNNKRYVYSDFFEGEHSIWRNENGYTKHLAFTKDKKTLISWIEGKENKRTYYILIDEEDLIPNLDFLYE